MKKTLLILTGAATSFYTTAQETPLLKPFDAGLHYGQLTTPAMDFSTEEWQRMDPQFRDWTMPGEDYNQHDWDGKSQSETIGLQMQFAVGKKAQESNNAGFFWGIGLGISGAGSAHRYYQKYTAQMVDTVTFSNGHQEYLHSDTSYHRNYTYKTGRSTLSTRFIYRAGLGKIISVYGGVGIQLGVSRRAELNYYAPTFISTYFSPDPSGGHSGLIYGSSYLNNMELSYYSSRKKTAFHYGVSLPVGFSIYLAKTHCFFSRVSVDLEFLPGFTATYIPELNKSKSGIDYAGQVRLNYRLKA